MTHLSTAAETPAETSSNSPATTGFSTETTLPFSTTSTGDSTATLNPLETESSTSYSSAPVSKSASQASEQTAPIGVSGHGSTATNNARTEETSSTHSATVTESSLRITSTKDALSPVTSEPNTQEDITSSSNQRTLNDLTATDLSHSSLHSTAEIPSTDTEKSALPVSTVILDSSTVAPTATSRFTTKIPPQTEVSQITGTSNTVADTERVPMASTSSDTTDTESNTTPAFTEKVSPTASVASEPGHKSTAFVGTNPMTHLSTMAQTAAEISSTTIFSSALTGLDTSLSLTSVTSSVSSSFSNPVQISTLTDMINSNETVTISSTTPITVPNTTVSQISSTFSTPNIAVSPPTTATTIISASPTKTSLTSKSTVIVATIVTAGDSSSKNTKPTVRITTPEAGILSTITANTLPQGSCTSLIFSIQLEKVTSEVIQLNWTPQGGTRDSPYTVYLLRDNTVRKKSTTNETWIAFGDLVPGYEYIISVEVLTCAKKINISKRVRTEAKTFDGKTRITNEIFKPEYNNKSSGEFKDFEKKFIGEMRKNLPPEMQRLLDEGKMRIVINNLRSGSILVDFMIVLDVGENVTKTELTAAFTEAFNNSTEFQMDRNGTLIEETNSCETGINSCSEHATCNASGPSYTCQCQAGFTDFSPSVPGRDCREPAGKPVTIAPSRQPSTSKPSVESISPTQESETAPATSINTTVPLPMLSPQSTSLIYPTTVNVTNVITSLITTTLQPTSEVTSTNAVSKVPTSNITLISPTGNTIITSTAIGKSTPTDKTTPIYTDTIATIETHFSTPATTETRVTLPVSSSVATKSTSTYSVNNTSLETTRLGTIATQSTAAPVSNAVLTNGTSRPSATTDTNDISTAPSTSTLPDATKTPSPVSTTQKSLSSTASSTERISTGSSGTSSTDTTRVTMIVEPSTTSASSTTKRPTTFSTIPVTPPYRSTIVTSPETFNRTTRSTVIVKGSTTNPTLTTTLGACTSLDFSIQLENVTSDMIQFNWTPQGGGIAYTASLLGDEEVKKTTTYKTTIAYEHLLPGQDYIISVEVLTCGKKTSTSMTVQTASKNFKGQTRLIDKVFNPQYRNKSSTAFKDFEKNFTDEIGEKLTGEFKNLFDVRKMRIVIDNLSNGSVTVLFNMVMPVQQNLTQTTVFGALIKALSKSALGRVDFNSTFIEAGNSCETGSKICSEHALCIREEATYSCKCKDGFYDHSPRVPGRDCQDINECATNASSCSRLATCNNTVGSYECNCNPGIKDENPTNPGRQCKDPVLCFSSANLCSIQNNDCLDSKNRICSSKQAFACEILFKNLVFGPELYNSESQRYRNLSQSITTDVVKQMQSSLGDDSFDIIVVGFRPGSVIAYFVSLLQGQQSIDANTLQGNLSKIVKNVFGNETEVTVQLLKNEMLQYKAYRSHNPSLACSLKINAKTPVDYTECWTACAYLALSIRAGSGHFCHGSGEGAVQSRTATGEASTTSGIILCAHSMQSAPTIWMQLIAPPGTLTLLWVGIGPGPFHLYAPFLAPGSPGGVEGSSSYTSYSTVTAIVQPFKVGKLLAGYVSRHTCARAATIWPQEMGMNTVVFNIGSVSKCLMSDIECSCHLMHRAF
ncbi:L-lactate dehydrogenase A chain [Platysternon megacephalum]|uniref:L-lactate dehydrogenase A chain n=1 Tax=Platysternon megacephalum TaxID=55544 RepID=A0A4D9EDL2_9SAUR|nr:L-lactate dehydrogenase A chain [Platysternon megacephalum]